MEEKKISEHKIQIGQDVTGSTQPNDTILQIV